VRRRPTGRNLSLTVRIALVCGLLVAVLGGAVLGVVFLFRLWPGYWPYWTLVAVVLVGSVVAHYRGAERLLLSPIAGRLVSSEDEPRLHAAVERLAALADLPAPRIAVSPSHVPNAFAFGVPGRSTVVVTAALREALEPGELEAVLAHELSHIANSDALVMTAATLPRTLGAEILGREGPGLFIWFFLWPFGLALWGLSALLTLALSRYREYAADRGSALLTGAPEQLESALQKLTGAVARIPQADMRGLSGLNAFFIIPTDVQRRRLELLIDHPPLAKRLARLSEMARELGRPVC
jgi:heat shock protein HtpX